MKRKYFIPFETKEERNRIRKWTGTTAGANLAVKTAMWSSGSDSVSWHATWTEGYVIDITSKKAEMLIKLQFAEARRYFEQSNSAFDGLDDAYFPGRR